MSICPLSNAVWIWYFPTNQYFVDGYPRNIWLNHHGIRQANLEKKHFYTFVLNQTNTLLRMEFIRICHFLMPPYFSTNQYGLNNCWKGLVNQETFLLNYIGSIQADSAEKNFKDLSCSPFLMKQQPNSSSDLNLWTVLKVDHQRIIHGK